MQFTLIFSSSVHNKIIHYFKNKNHIFSFIGLPCLQIPSKFIFVIEMNREERENSQHIKLRVSVTMPGSKEHVKISRA